MNESMRRLISDKPVKSSEADRQRISEDVQAFLDSGGKISHCEAGETGIARYRLSKDNRRAMNQESIR